MVPKSLLHNDLGKPQVVEEILPDGCALRWMVCEEAFSLDQTRVKLGLGFGQDVGWKKLEHGR